jgi:PAS domain S-box-containing protein
MEISNQRREDEDSSAGGSADKNVISLTEAMRAQPIQRGRWPTGLVDALPAAVYTTDAAGRLTYFNEAAATLWGNRPTLGTTEFCGSWRLYWPDGTPMDAGDCPMAVALREQKPVRGVEAICERPDGTRVPMMPYPTPLFDESGRMTGAVNMLVDITEQKRAEDQQAMLVRELHHRVKNTLANVQAIMGATARSAHTIEDFMEALIGRIGSLARTHLLLAEDGKAVGFEDILGTELDPFDDRTRIVLIGPPVALPTPIAVSLGMAVHEMVTNAARFGALSVHDGKVEVTWRVTIEATRRTLEFDWVESGGPKVTGPERKGFGTRLMELVLPGQIQAKSRIEYAAEGIRAHYTVPLPLED